MATPAPTRIGLTAPAQVLAGVPFTIAGRGSYLFNGSWVGLNDQLVTIQTGRTSSGPWAWLAYVHTTSAGLYTLRTRQTRNTYYRAVVHPTGSISTSTSTPRLVTIVVPESVKLLRVPATTIRPVNVPYGIGKRLYLNSLMFDLTSRWWSLVTDRRGRGSGTTSSSASGTPGAT